MKKRYKITLGGLVLCLMVYFSLPMIIAKIGGASSQAPEHMNENLSKEAMELIDSAYEGLNSNDIIDIHTHIAGTGNNSDCFVNENMQSFSHPIEFLKFQIYLNAAGVSDLKNVDQEYIKRLVSLVSNNKNHGKHTLLAFDKNYKLNGEVDLSKTQFYVSNEYVFKLSEDYLELFTPCISVHPYRKDALSELDKWGKKGAKIVKWLPNAMNIDPSNPKCDSYYEKMREYNMVLLTHAGHEKAVHSEEAQKLGNPLLLRRPLDLGVRVIIAHCASLGKSQDLDSDDKKLVKNFDLFLRLMDEEKYKGLLFGDISAMTQINRVGKPLKTILKRKDLHSRLINGSDYPLPAINALISTIELQNLGYISSKEKKYLDEIYDYNPLIFDFVLKRTLHLPGNDTLKLSDCIFVNIPELI
ncbi:MAG: amidohydrolase [Bacteroidia bacterium]|nr:amidohydrolase [Bacteroidia bacterium]